ncbi:MAG: hypothetical protein WC613_02065 [Candidatus Aenigmatarchaeota archaeon]
MTETENRKDRPAGQPGPTALARNFDAEACGQLGRYVSGVDPYASPVCPALARNFDAGCCDELGRYVPESVSSVDVYPTGKKEAHVGLVRLGDFPTGC